MEEKLLLATFLYKLIIKYTLGFNFLYIMKNMDEIEQLNQKGFVLKKGFFNPQELDNLKDEGQKIFFN